MPRGVPTSALCASNRLAARMSDYLDHIIWACDDLDRGMSRLETLTGVAPRYGGVHAGGATHNAIVALDGGRYLEVFAPTSASGAGDNGWARLARASSEPQVLTYCMRSPLSLAELALRAANNQWGNAVVADNSRVTADGELLRWQWIAPQPAQFGMEFPFFIDWLDSPHPSVDSNRVSPSAGLRLKSFLVGCPGADRLGRIMSDLGSPISTYVAETVQFRVLLDTPKGMVSL